MMLADGRQKIAIAMHPQKLRLSVAKSRDWLRCVKAVDMCRPVNNHWPIHHRPMP